MPTSFSETDTYGKCPKLFSYKYIRNLQPVRQNTNLFKGITAHDILRDWYLAQRAGEGREVSEFMVTWMAEFWAEFDSSSLFEDELFDVRKEVEALGWVVETYLERGEFDDWEILHVEEEFQVKVDDNEVSFTPDLVARDPSGVVWGIDHKTTGSKIDKDALDIRPQSLFYYMGIQQFYPEVGGFIFNYMRKKVPTVPRLNKTGKKAVNDLNRIDTTYEILRDFINENGLADDEAHRRRLAELRDEDTFYFMHRMYITDDMVEEESVDLAARLRLMDVSIQEDLFPRTIQPFNGCKRCPFNALCFTELTGGNTDIVLDWYEEREPKNPYERDDEDAEG